MSAAEIIDHIRTLPPAEQAEVVTFVQNLGKAREVKFATDVEATTAGDGVIRQHEEVFQKLSQ